MADFYLAGESALWVQPDGPNTKPEFLGCHQMGDLTNPLGEMNVKFVPDPAIQGRFKPAAWFQGEPGVITTSLTTYISSVADWLGKIARRRCPFPLYVFKGNCGRRDVFYAWERGFGLNPAVLTQRMLSNLAAREPGDEGVSEQTFNIGAMEFYEWFDLSVDINQADELWDYPFTSIWACSMLQCATPGCDEKNPCSEMIAGSQYDATPVVNLAKVFYTLDQGETWAECATSPCDPARTDDILSVVCFPINATTMRWLVVTEKGGLTLPVYYSDDHGTTWTEALAWDGAYAVGKADDDARILFCLDMHHIWLVCSKGHIFFSSDGGVTWTTQLATNVLPHFRAVWFADDLHGMAVGDSDDIATTSDGGANWAIDYAATGDTNYFTCVTENAGGGIWWIGSGQLTGKLYYSTDFGVTWTRRLGLPGDGYAEIKSIRFADRLTGFIIQNDKYWGDPSPPVVGEYIFQTVNGGYSWKSLAPVPDNLGVTDLVVCDANTAFVTGASAVNYDELVLKVHE